jgi:hypothetical protein
MSKKEIMNERSDQILQSKEEKKIDSTITAENNGSLLNEKSIQIGNLNETFYSLYNESTNIYEI